MGLVNQLGILQQEILGIFTELYKEGGADDVQTDELIAMTIAVREADGNTDEPTEADVLYAMEILDHLDTLGMAVRAKAT